MKTHDRIAIDGTAASGKTTVGKLVAVQLGYLFLDTGIMYRLAAFAGVREGVDPADNDAITTFAHVISCDVVRDAESSEVTVLMTMGRTGFELSSDRASGEMFIYYNGEEITGRLHMPEVDKVVSAFAANPAIRSALTGAQQKIGAFGSIVMIGRDIGTVVMPDAPIKIFLIASAEKRAERRHNENLRNGVHSVYDEILADIKKRDYQDSHRKTAPLTAAADAYQINTDELTAEEVAAEIMKYIEER